MIDKSTIRVGGCAGLCPVRAVMAFAHGNLFMPFNLHRNMARDTLFL